MKFFVLDSLITCYYNNYVICNCAGSVINKFKFNQTKYLNRGASTAVSVSYIHISKWDATVKINF